MPEKFTPSPSPSVEIRRNGRITDMILPNGEVRIIYGVHDYPVETSLIPKETDGIFLDNLYTPRTRKGLNSFFKGHKQLEYVRDYAKNNNIPVLFHDVEEKKALTLTRSTTEKLSNLAILSPFVVLGLTSASILEAIALTSPLLYHSVVHNALRFTPSENYPDLFAKVSRTATKAAPYMGPYVIRLRNALWAAKINWALENDIGNHFTTIVGATHVGLEDYLKMEAEDKEAKILRASSSIWPFFADTSSYYTFRRFSQRRPMGAFDDVRVYEVPKLKALALGV